MGDMNKLETDSTQDGWALSCYQLASWLTDPICKMHECYWRGRVVDRCHPSSYAITNIFRKAVLYLAVIPCALVGLVTSPLGMGMRFVGNQIASKPFIHLTFKDVDGKALPEDSRITGLMRNICGVKGGYLIINGGVMPEDFRVDWVEWIRERVCVQQPSVSPEVARIDRIAQKILEEDADVYCGYEVFDVKTALYLAEKLKGKYKDFYVNVGAQPLGTSAALFVASKFDTQNAQFTPFSKETLPGDAKYSGKGFLSFEIGKVKKENSYFNKFATLVTTHLLHSEIPSQPTCIETRARKNQMDQILRAKEKMKGSVLLVGDLNFDRQEYAKAGWSQNFGEILSYQTNTWGGDEYCSTLISRLPSSSRDLDYWLAFKGSGARVESVAIPADEVEFVGSQFNRKAASDHTFLKAVFTV